MPLNTPYQYVGEIPALGHLQLTELVKTFQEIQSANLEAFFPYRTSNERTIVIETVKQGLGTMPIVEVGVPAGNFSENDRVFRRTVEPVLLREDDFIDQYVINQLRQVGTLNDPASGAELVAQRVQRMLARHDRTVEMLRAQVMLGGIDYYEPRTNYSINVPTNIPTHNYFDYDGYNGAFAADADLTGTPYTAYKALTNSKGRPEANLFTNANGQAGVPWTHPVADIIRSCRLLKQYLTNTNKNVPTDLIMSRDLYTVLQENELMKAYTGGIGIIAPGANPSGASANNPSAPFVQLGAGGEITSICGMNVTLIDTLYRDPQDSVVKKMWPSNIVAFVARNHSMDPSASLGYTQQVMGESPEGTPGLWMRTGPDQQPPSPPGRTMQMGNALMPFAMYPEWISLVKVAEENDVDMNLWLRSDIEYNVY